jgi:hypothetical protein
MKAFEAKEISVLFRIEHPKEGSHIKKILREVKNAAEQGITGIEVDETFSFDDTDIMMHLGYNFRRDSVSRKTQIWW